MTHDEFQNMVWLIQRQQNHNHDPNTNVSKESNEQLQSDFKHKNKL